MIKSKKILLAGIMTAFVTVTSFAQDVSFENKLKWGVVDITVTDDDTESELATFNNEAKAEYASEKLDFGVTLKFDAGKSAADKDVFEFGSDGYVDDAYIEFRPIDLIGINFHRKYCVAGSYLPCLEKEIEEANIGSDFGAFLRPIDGLIIGGGLDFISKFGSDDEKPILNFGAEYAFQDMITFGASFRNVAAEDEDARTIGVYASYTGIEGLTLNAGFTKNGNLEDYNVTGDLINAAVMFNKDALGIFANLVFSVGGEKDVDKEIYAGANVCYNVTDAFAVSLYGGYSDDFDNDDSWGVEINPAVSYTINDNHNVGAGVFVFLMKDTTNISFPVYWKYTF